MNRIDFSAFCAAHNLSTEDAGRDWHDAGIRGGFLCAVIRDSDDFAAVKPLLDNNQAYLASSERKHGNGWFNHNGYGQIYADDASDVALEMADQYARFLGSKENISYYSVQDIARRDKALADNPALEDEWEDDHFERVTEMQNDGWLAPLYVTEPGYWDCNGQDLLLSETEETTTGVWSYSYDNWEQCVILVLNDTEEDES
jgi:hypothetical protein